MQRGDNFEMIPPPNYGYADLVPVCKLYRSSKSIQDAFCLNCGHPAIDHFMNDKSDKVNSVHYRKGKIEVWDFIADQNLDYFLGNVVKYVCRSPHKGEEVEDLHKAIAYLQQKIKLVEGKSQP